MTIKLINTPSLEWHTQDKTEWGNGPWQSEPDKAQWQDPKTGLPCLAVRHVSSGHWCGYVGIPLDSKLAEQNNENYEVHGGITFQGKCEERENEPGFDGSIGICHRALDGKPVMWLGFDCAHSGDMCPAMIPQYKKWGMPAAEKWMSGESYRTLDYVKSEIRELALQIKADLEPAA